MGYATRHAATAGIVDRTGASGHGHVAVATPVEQVVRFDGYDAAVLGWSAYVTHWLNPTGRFGKNAVS